MQTLNFLQSYTDASQRDLTPEELANCLRQLLKESEEAGAEQWQMFFKGRIANLEANHPEALNCYENLLCKDPSPGLFHKALFWKGASLAMMENAEEAIGVFTELIHWSSAAEAISGRVEFAKAVLSSGILLGQIGQYEKALLQYDDMLYTFSDSSDPVIASFVYMAKHNRGQLATLVHNSVETEPSKIDLSIEDIGEETRRRRYVEELAAKSILLCQLGQLDNANDICCELLDQFGRDSDDAIIQSIADALVRRVSTLVMLRQHDDVIAACDHLLNHFSHLPHTGLRIPVAGTLLIKGTTLGILGRDNEVVNTLDDLLKRFANDKDAEMAIPVASALYHKGYAQSLLGYHEQAIRTYDALLCRFKNEPRQEVRQFIANALYSKGVELQTLGRIDEEIAAYDELLKRFMQDSDTEMLIHVVRALFNKAIRLSSLDHLKDAILIYDQLFILLKETHTIELRQILSKALLNKASLLCEIGDLEKAITLLDENINRFSLEVHFKDLLSCSLALKGRILKALNKEKEGETLLKQAIDLSPNTPYVQYTYALLSPHGKLVSKLASLLKNFDKCSRMKFSKRIHDNMERFRDFLRPTMSFDMHRSILLILREWNSFTPIIPDRNHADRGGGYFLWHRGRGIVVDPGYNFIENFWRAGGRINDIHSIVITHAHDDHTSDFESILTLIHQYNSANSKTTDKKVDIFLSKGAERKLSGLFRLRDDSRIGRVVILNKYDGQYPQVVHLFNGVSVTVLPAYHDDLITVDGSVGLLFRLMCGDEYRTVLFTGDTGLYPNKIDNNCNVLKYPDGTPQVDFEMESDALHCLYTDIFRKTGIEQQINIIIPHLGSIKRYELDTPSVVRLGNCIKQGA